MFENAHRLLNVEEESDSELYSDAIDGEKSVYNINDSHESEIEELRDFHSTSSILEINEVPSLAFEMGVYKQILETRVVLTNSNKYCTYSDRRNPRISNVKETVLTCQIANKTKPRPLCPICGLSTIQCVCKSSNEAANNSKQKIKLCSNCKHTSKYPCEILHANSRSKRISDNNEDLIGLLRKMEKIPIYTNCPGKLSTQLRNRHRSNRSKVPMKYDPGILDTGSKSSCTQITKGICSNPDDFKLLPTVQGNKLTEALKRRQYINCVKSLGQCTCGNILFQKKEYDPNNCQLSNPLCMCNKRKSLIDHEKLMSIIVVSNAHKHIECLCAKNGEKNKGMKLAGIIEEISTYKPKQYQVIKNEVMLNEVHSSKNKIDSREIMQREEEIRVDSFEPALHFAGTIKEKKPASSPVYVAGSMKPTSIISEITKPVLAHYDKLPHSFDDYVGNLRPVHVKNELSQYVTSDKKEHAPTHDGGKLPHSINSDKMKSTRTHVMRKLSISISNHIKNSAPAQPKEKLPVNRRGNIPNSLPEDIKSTSSAHVKEKLTLNVEKKLPNSITEDTKNATSTNVKIKQPFDIKDTLPDSISNGIKTTNLAHVKKKLPMHTEKKLQQSISRNRKNPISICSNENQTESSSTKDNDLVRSKINDDKTFVGISEDCLKQQKHEGKDVEVRQLKKRKNTSKYFDEDVMLGVQMKKRSHIKTNDVQQMDQENEEGIEILEIKANKQREKPKTEEKTEEQPIQQKVAGLRPNKEVISDDVNSHQEFDEQQLKVHDQNIVAITSGNVPEDEAEMKTVNVIKENIVIENVIEQINITIEITEKNNVGDKVTDLEPANKMDLALPSIQNDLEQHDLSIKLEEKLAKPSLKAEESREIKYVDKEKLGHEISDPKKDMCNVPIIEVGKCTPCTSVGRNCSKIPKSIYPVLSKDNNSKIKKEYIKLCQCINGETNTEQNHFIGKPEKRQDKQEGQILHCKNCKSCNEKVETNVFTSTNKMVDDKKEDNKCKRSCFTRKRGLKKPSISIPCKRHILQPKDNEISWNINEHTYKSQRSSSTYKSCKEKGISLCSMSSRAELASTLQEIMTYKGKNWPSTKSLISETRNSQIYHCHTANNTENIDKSSKLFQRKRCTQSQTGGTLEQDMIASYVASCSTNPERRHSQQFIIQTLLYHFAGYEHNKECTSRRRQRFAEKPRVEIKKRSTNSLKQYISMRSIQVQVGPICSLKCEGAQTVTTFVITDTNAEQEIVPSLEAHGRINYICGPDVPGIRTKIAMNLNQLPSYTGCSECSSDLKNIESSSKSSGECEPPICSYFRNENHYIEEVDCTKPCCSVLKKDKYVFITVTPVQTEPYEPNYFIIVTSPNNVNKNMEEEIKPTKDKRKPGKLSKKLDVPSKLKESLDHSKKAMFSVETLKSRELFKLVNNQPSLLRVAGIAESTHGSSVDLPCITAQQHLEILKEFELACIQGDEFKSLQDNCCGPDSCENFIESRIPPKDECVECCFSKEKNSTRTVACGSHNCILQKEVDEERFEDAYSNLSTMNSNHKKPHKITKNIRCGPEICSFMMPPAEINLFGINLCTSTQTDDLLSNRISFNSPNVIMVTLGCDAFTMDSTNVTESEMDCCDLRKCKNSFEKGESDRRECMERKICGTDLCTNAREKLEGICFTDGVDLCDSCTIKADILCDPYIRSMNNKDRLLEDSFNDPSLCRSIGGSEADQCDPVIRENQYYDTESADVISKENEDKSEACGDKDCPEKTNKDYIGGSTDFSEGDNEGKKDEREDVVCSRKHVTTKLDQNDLFALELAVNRFIKAKPESINEK